MDPHAVGTGFSEPTVKTLLFWSEVALFIFGIMAVVGHFGKERKRKKVFLTAPIASWNFWTCATWQFESRERLWTGLLLGGLVLELIADAGVFVSGELLREMNDIKVAMLETNNTSLVSSNLALAKDIEILRKENDDRELAIQSLEPSNQPIFEVSAFALIEVKGSNHIEVPHWGGPLVAWLSCCTTPLLAGIGASAMPLLESDHFDQSFRVPSGDSRQYSLRFQMESVGGSIPADFGRANALDGIRFLRLAVKFLPLDAEIIGGTAKITINANIRKEFQIPPQKAFEPLFLTNNSAYHDTFNIIARVGTNELPENHGPKFR